MREKGGEKEKKQQTDKRKYMERGERKKKERDPTDGRFGEASAVQFV